MSAPVVRFESEVFHRKSLSQTSISISLAGAWLTLLAALIDPKTKIWFPLGELATWRCVSDAILATRRQSRCSTQLT